MSRIRNIYKMSVEDLCSIIEDLEEQISWLTEEIKALQEELWEAKQ